MKINYIYAIGCESGPIKIGITNSLFSRLSSLQTGSFLQLWLLYAMPCIDRDHALKHEKIIHDVLEENKIIGEWFNLTAPEAIEAIQTSFQIEEYQNHTQIFAKINKPVVLQ